MDENLLFFVRGSSSFLFAIPVYVSYIYGNYSAFVLNTLLILSSFLYNGGYYSIRYEQFDYLVITLIGVNYINQIFINTLLLLLGYYEYQRTKSIEYTKDISMMMGAVKGIVVTYYHSELIILYLLLMSIVYACTIRAVRRFFYYRYNGLHNLLFTYLFHICVTNILCISI